MNLFDLEAVLTLNSASYMAGLATAETSTNTAGNKMMGVFGKLAGAIATLQIGKKLVGFGQDTINAASSFESAFTGVRKTVDATEEEFSQLSQWIMEASTKMALSKEGIAGTMEIAGQLGVRGVEDLEAFTETMVMLGDTTNLNAEEAAGALARFMNITGDATTDVSKIGSVIVDLGNNFATTESDIVNMATRLASAGTIAGLSSTDILALSTAMSSVGIQAEAGGTAMAQTLATMQKATELAGTAADENGKWAAKLESLAQITGMTGDEFKAAWGNDTIGILQRFIKGLGNTETQGKSTMVMLSDLGLSGIRQTNMLQSLSLANEMLGGAVETANRAFEENVALSDEAEKRYGTTESKALQTAEAFGNLKVAIGNELVPAYSSLMTWMQKFMEKAQEFVSSGKLTETFNKIKDAVDKTSEAFAPFIEKVQTFFSGIDFESIKETWSGAIERISEAWTHLKESLQPVIDAIGEFIDSGTASEGATALITGGIELLSVAIAGLIDGLATIIDKISAFVGWLNSGSTSSDVFKAVIIGLTAAIVAYNAVLAASAIVKNSSAIASALLMAKEIALEAITNGLAAAQALLNTVLSANPIGIVVAAAAALTAAFIYLWNTNEGFRNFFIEAWGNIKEFFGGVGEFFGKTFDGIKQFGQDTWDKITGLFSGIGGFFEEKFSAAKGAVQLAFDGIKSFAAETRENISQKFNDIGSWFSEKFNNAKESAHSAFQGLKEKMGETREKINTVFENIGSWFSEKFNDAKEKAHSAFKGIKDYMSQNWDDTQDVFTNVGAFFFKVFSDAKNKVVEAWDDIKEKMAEIWEKIKSAFGISEAFEWGKDMIENFIGGIKSMISRVGDAVSGVANKVKEFIGFSEPDKGPLSNFHTFAPDMMNLFIKGIKDNQTALQDAVASAFDFEGLITSPTADIQGRSDSTGAKGGNYYTINVNQPVSTPADMLREIRTEAQYGLMIGESLA